MVRSFDELCRVLDIDVAELPQCYQAEQDFPVRAPRSYLQNIEKGNLSDPLLLQVLPQASEMVSVEGFTADPLEEARFNVAPGLNS